MALDPSPFGQLNSIQLELIRITQAWALRQKADLCRAAELRRQAALLLHAHYLETIPAYGRLAHQEGIGPLDDVEPIKTHLMFPDDLFKSYNQKWLDDNDFGRMTGWLSEIFHQRVSLDTAGIGSIDEWIDRLEAGGVRIIYSSGTSGNLSFVPRDSQALQRLRTASASYLAPLLFARQPGWAWQRPIVGAAARVLPPETFARLGQRLGAKDFDAVFLDFSHGRTGNQTLMRELAPVFRRHFFLYETDLSPSLLRLMARGPRTEPDREALARLHEVVVIQKEANYQRVAGHIRQSTADGQKVFIFGTTHQYKELCDGLAARGETLAMRPGSMLMFGGGWKSFTGARISRDELVSLMAERLGVPPAYIIEGYSMTEINAFMLRCDHGRFHLPPLIEPVIFDEELLPMAVSADQRGVFGFLDPLASAYPGFLVSGDEVRLVTGDCPCGLSGPAVTEIGRARAREMKGCGGIMASLAA
jgi:hypothetical protein